MNDQPTSPPRTILKEAITVYTVGFFLILALAISSLFIAPIYNNLYLIVAAVFFGLPILVFRKKDLNPDDFGLTTGKRFFRNIGIGVVAAILTLAPFIIGQYWWETQVQKQEFHFDTNNWNAWDVSLEGAPKTGSWTEHAGAWLWSQERDLVLGVRSDVRRRGAVVLESSTPFTPKLDTTKLSLKPLGKDEDTKKATSWQVTPVAYGHLIKATWKETPDALIPSDLTVKTTRVDGFQDDPFELYLGPAQQKQKTPSEGVPMHKSSTWLWMWLLTQLFFIALPEEYFYRGYLQTRLAQALPKKEGKFWRLVTPANLLASFLFGIGHLLIPVGGAILAARFSVFFPSLLFGLLRERTGTITASVVYHASCNMMVLIMAVHYWRL